MNYKTPRLGIDRFLALRWADMALDLYISIDDKSKARKLFRSWLFHEIEGQVSARKTADQINRIWLVENDPFEYLRKMVISNGLAANHKYRAILHYGLAINAFPLFGDVCRATGRLLNLQPSCTIRDIYQRVQEKYGNPASIERASRRTLQTLIDWNLLIEQDRKISVCVTKVDNPVLTEWFVVALMAARSIETISLEDISKAPELLGVQITGIRAAIYMSKNLRFERRIGDDLVLVSH